MKRFVRRGIAVLLAILVLLSAFYVNSFAAVSQPSANTGTRDEVCNTLADSTAGSYYTGSYTYDTLSGLSSSALLTQLRSLMTNTHTGTSSYDNCYDYSMYTDCQNGDETVVLLYTSYAATDADRVSGATGWNREHVWPKSLGGYETSGPGADLHHIRPVDCKVNSTRGNMLYGNVSGGTQVTGSDLVGGMVGGAYSGGYFEPLDNAKGDVARICLYMYARYGGDSSYTCSDITTVFQSVAVLLEWCELDPVDTWEMERNDVIEEVQGNRNVFIDYPEYAWLLFNEEIPNDMVTPSGEAMGTSSGSGSTGSDTGSGDSGSTGTGDSGNTGTGDSGSTGTGGSGSTGATGDIVFDFTHSEEGTTGHSDSTSDIGTSSTAPTFTSNCGNYTLTYSDATKVYTSKDETGKGALKLGSSSAVGSITITVPDDVTSVTINYAGYKAKTGELSVNGTAYATTTQSNNGEYASVTIDTTTTKELVIASTSTSDPRLMIDSIVYHTTDDAGDSGDTGSGDSGDTGTGDSGNTGSGDSGDTTTTEQIIFDFVHSSEGTTGHSDSTSDIGTSSTAPTFTSNCGNYTLTYSDATKVYTSKDETGKGALKLGTGSVVGSITITVPDDVTSVTINYAGYKAKTGELSVNGTAYATTTQSNNGEYASVTIDTTTTKELVIASTSTSDPRLMIDSIIYSITTEAGGSDTGSGGTTPDEPVNPVEPTPDEDIDPADPIEPDTDTGDATTENIVFEFGENGSATHSDGTAVSTSTSYTSGDYTLDMSELKTFYGGAFDATGKSAIKLGSSKNVGGFTFTVPDEVTSVIIMVAQYKANATTVDINGTQYVIETASNNGEYTAIEIDTTETKTVTLATVSGKSRAMIDSITYVIASSTPSFDCENNVHDKNDYGYCTLCQADIESVRLTISTNLSLYYSVLLSDNTLLELGAPSMQFTFNGSTVTVTQYTLTDNSYVFGFNGIAPDQMTMTIKADFYLGTTLIETLDGYSVEANCQALLIDYANDETLVQLINDVLLYGKYAQEYTGTNSTDIAGDGMTLTPTDAAPEASDAMTITGNTDASFHLSAIGVHFDYVNSIYVKAYIPDPALFGSITAGGVEYTLESEGVYSLGNGYYQFYFAPVKATQLDNFISISLTDSEGVEYTNITYSVNSYAYAMVNGGSTEGSAMYNLALALYRYGKAADSYLLAHSS